MIKVQKFLKDNSTTILTVLGVAGVIGTSVVVGKNTLKASEKLKQAKENNLKPISTAVLVGSSYIPSILLGGSTIACIIGANVLNKRQQAAIMSAYMLTTNAFKEYRGKLIELHGEEMDKEIREEIVRNHSDFHQIFVDTPDQKVFWYEPVSKTYIERYEREIMDAEYHLNRNFVMRGYSPLNELLEFLGIPQSELGDSCGWTAADGYIWLDFEHTIMGKHEGRPCYCINAVFAPDTDYMSDWE